MKFEILIRKWSNKPSVFFVVVVNTSIERPDLLYSLDLTSFMRDGRYIVTTKTFFTLSSSTRAYKYTIIKISCFSRSNNKIITKIQWL